MLLLAFASSAFAGPVSVPSPFRVTVRGHGYSIASGNLLTGSGVATPAVTAWVGRIAKSAKTSPKNATRTLNSKTHKFVFKAGTKGYSVNQAASVSLITAELNAEIAGAGARTVALPVTATNPKTTKFGKAIVVVLGQKRIYLWDGTKIVKEYRCAIGKAQYPTPTGTFYIGRKVKNPTWTRPNSAWAKGMPAYIGPGPSNPLGTRALYVYNKSGDTGVRFHGTTNLGSVGQASSHGCMRMVRKNVEDFYNRVPVDTPVTILK
jgi:lipoprotein-anchoring transpeptidase ErfK/SrfK